MFKSIALTAAASAATLTMFWALPAAALEADEVRGEIVSVEPDQDTLRLRVEESGDQLHASPGTVNEYRIDADTEVQLEDPTETVLGATAGDFTIDDLAPGTEVILRFEDVGGQYVARDMRTPGDEDATGQAQPESELAAAETGTGAADQQQMGAAGERERLPDTASMAPLLALTGLGFAALAFALRLLRRR